MADWVADYRSTLSARSIAPSVASGEVFAGLAAHGCDDGVPFEQVLDEFEQTVMPGVLHWGHPAFLGYFGSTSNGPALLGEFAAAALNVSAMTWQTSPAATEMETLTVRWIRELIKLPDTFFGVVYDTASIATLHALAAARERYGNDVRGRGLAGRSDFPTFRIYASDQAHSSVEKAAVVLGIGERNVVRVPTGKDFRMRAEPLRRAIEADRVAGSHPLAIVATIGTTSTASVDAIREIAEVCTEQGIWLHVDAAYGGAMGALEEGGWAMDGAELADSVVVNPHKWLFVPLDFSTLYVRDPELLRSVFSLIPDYLAGDSGTADFPDYMDYSIQLGRRFRALKAWMVFRSFGANGIAARIREHCRLARVFQSWILQESDFVLGAPVTMGVVCFRFEPKGWSAPDADALNAAVVAELNSAGRVFLTRTKLNGRTNMRIGLGNMLTTEAHLGKAWGEIASVARRIGDSSPFSASRVVLGPTQQEDVGPSH